MDYDVLKLVKIQYIPVNFDYSFELMNIDVVPFVVECKDFPRLNSNVPGASGIGSLNRTSVHPPPQLFLPYYMDELDPFQKEFLDCEVTILNDILFHHEIYFEIDGVITYSINLKDFYHQHKNDTNMAITMHCQHLDELPCGCKEPTSEEPCNKDEE